MRFCAYLGGLAVLSIAAAQIFQSPPSIVPIKPLHRADWTTIDKPFPAFALDIPEASGVLSSYVVRRQPETGAREDIITLGDAQSTAPYLEVIVHRPGRVASSFADPQDELKALAAEAGPAADLVAKAPLLTKFGPLSLGSFDITAPPLRHCLGFVRNFDDPPLQMSGRFCQGGTDYIERSTLACALDRLTLLAAGSEPRLGTLFAKAELNRNFCGERDPILAPTPKYKLLWQALATRPEPRRIGR